MSGSPPVPPPPPPGLTLRPPLPPDARWWVRYPTGRQFGPVTRDVIVQWIAEGRAGTGCLVAHEGGGSWKPLESAFPEWTERQAAVRRDPFAPGKNALLYLPNNGILEAVVCEREKLPRDMRKQHEATHERLEKEADRSALGLRFLGSKSITLERPLPFDPELDSPLRLVPEVLLIGSFRWMEQEFHIVVPWGRLGQMPHEYFSLLPGVFPSALALRRKNEHVFDHGVWLGADNTGNGIVAHEARLAQPELAEGIAWRWLTGDSAYEMILVWGLQIVPLGARGCLHVMQTAMHGALRRVYGLDWYLHRQHGFLHWRDRLHVTGDHHPHFLFGCSTGQLLGRLVQ